MLSLAWPIAAVVICLLAHHAVHSGLGYLRERAKALAVEAKHSEALESLRKQVVELEKAVNGMHNARVVAAQGKRLGGPTITGL